MTALPSSPTGQRFGRYRLVRQVGRGGMASVYLAQLEGAHGFEKWVAVKLIQPQLAQDERLLSMFLDEVRVTSRLLHANVCAVLDSGVHEGTPFLVMELLEGVPFSAALRRGWESGDVAPELVARVIADAARGLHAAHELCDRDGDPLGVVHRDVSPQNLFVLFEGAIKVLDFGIARARGRMSVTRTGELKGKVAYMAPEQFYGEEIDRRTDIWALGVLLWEGTVGDRLFRAGDRAATVTSVLDAPIPRPTRIRADYPQALEAIVMRALERDPEKRIGSAAELADELEAFIYGSGQPCGPAQVAAWMARLFPEEPKVREHESDEPSLPTFVSIDEDGEPATLLTWDEVEDAETGPGAGVVNRGLALGGAAARNAAAPAAVGPSEASESAAVPTGPRGPLGPAALPSKPAGASRPGASKPGAASSAGAASGLPNLPPTGTDGVAPPVEAAEPELPGDPTHVSESHPGLSHPGLSHPGLSHPGLIDDADELADMTTVGARRRVPVVGPPTAPQSSGSSERRRWRVALVALGAVTLGAALLWVSLAAPREEPGPEAEPSAGAGASASSTSSASQGSQGGGPEPRLPDDGTRRPSWRSEAPERPASEASPVAERGAPSAVAGRDNERDPAPLAAASGDPSSPPPASAEAAPEATGRNASAAAPAPGEAGPVGSAPPEPSSSPAPLPESEGAAATRPTGDRKPRRRPRARAGLPADTESGVGDAREPGKLNLLAIPSATVRLRGEVLGRTPLIGHPLPPGRHRLELELASGGGRKQVVVDVASGEVTRRVVRMVEAPDAP